MGRPTPQKLILLSLLLFFIANCSESKNEDANEIFPEDGAATGSGACTGESVKDKFIVEWKDGQVSVERGINREQFIRDFINPQIDRIDHVEYDKVIRAQIDQVPALPEISASASPIPSMTWGQTLVKASAAWSRDLTGQNTVVAVIDTGVDIAHVQLKSQIHINTAELDGEPGVDDDKNGYVDDVTGWNFVNNSPLNEDNQYHGTHVAGIIAADHSAGRILGIAPKTKIMPLAFLDSRGSGFTSTAVQAIQYAIDNGANVINASWGGGPCSHALENMIAKANQQGVFFVAAAGNEGLDLDRDPDYPASYGANGYESMIVVGASTPSDFQASFSNYSPTAVQIVAPGTDIFSLYPQDKIVNLNGTSMAAPFISGALAVLLSHPSKPSVKKIRDALLLTVRSGRFNVQTSGRMDLSAAITYLDQN